jgi:hypothetical protein
MTSGHCHNRFSLTWLYGVKERDDCVEVVVHPALAHPAHSAHPAHPDQHQDKNNEKEATNETKAIAETKTKTIQLKRWSTFRCHHFPDGAIVIGFRGRRDYKDGVCQGIMCYAWSKEQNHFIPVTYTISNGYNSKISATDFETLELCEKEEFTLKNPDAVISIKTHLR